MIAAGAPDPTVSIAFLTLLVGLLMGFVAGVWFAIWWGERKGEIKELDDLRQRQLQDLAITPDDAEVFAFPVGSSEDLFDQDQEWRYS
jgi:uncharacterized protein YjiS (DUF1127 family)